MDHKVHGNGCIATSQVYSMGVMDIYEVTNDADTFFCKMFFYDTS